MAELPVEIQAALDAYLGARVDDATWEAYVNRLGPGMALDVATDLCLWTTADADAVAWVRREFESNSEDRDDPFEFPLGIQRYSASLEAFLAGEPSMGSYTVMLRRELHDRDLWNVTHTVRLEYDDWESEGCYRADESLAERDLIYASGDMHHTRVDPWPIAACRAACLAWAPEWARSQKKS